MDHPTLTEEWFESELRQCKALAENHGITLQSFVFPQNKERFVEILSKYGFAVYRGPTHTWYRNFPPLFKKIAHAIDNYCALGTHPVAAAHENNIWNIPGSYFYVHKRGWAKWLPVANRVSKTKRGIDRAITEQAIYHLWFHPFNLVDDTDEMMMGLHDIFEYVNALQKQGIITSVTMREALHYL